MPWPCQSSDSHTLALGKPLRESECWDGSWLRSLFPLSNLDWTFVYWLWLENTGQVCRDRWWLIGAIAHITRERFISEQVFPLLSARCRLHTAKAEFPGLIKHFFFLFSWRPLLLNTRFKVRSFGIVLCTKHSTSSLDEVLFIWFEQHFLHGCWSAE